MGATMQAHTRRSRGCFMCRSKKVKCGEEKPTCSRCTRLETDCVYPELLDIDFRDESKKASARAVTLWRRRAAKGEEKNMVESDRPVPLTDLSSYRTPSLVAATPVTGLSTVQSTALFLFFREFTSTQSKVSPWLGFFQDLPDVWASRTPDSSLSHAVLAVALARLSKKQQSVELELLARSEYGQALQLVNRRLKNYPVPNRELMGHDLDEILGTIYIMGLFESVITEKNEPDSPWSQHLEGAIAMLKLHSTQHSLSLISTAVSSTIFFHMLVRCLNTRRRPQLPLQILPGHPSNLLPGAQLLRLMHRTAELCAIVEDGVTQCPCPNDEIYGQLIKIVADAQALDKDMLGWETALPQHFHFHTVEVNPWLTSTHSCLSWPGAPKVIHIYKSIFNAVPRMFCYATRIILNQSLVKCLNFLSQQDKLVMESHYHYPRATITSIIHSICQSVFSPLEGAKYSPPLNSNGEGNFSAVRGLVVKWPVHVALSALADEAVQIQIAEETRGWLELVELHAEQMIGISGTRHL